MPKVLGKITKEEIDGLQNIQDHLKELKAQQEIYTLKIEVVNLKMSIEDNLKNKILNDIKSKYDIEDLSKIIIKETGEVIDISEIPVVSSECVEKDE